MPVGAASPIVPDLELVPDMELESAPPSPTIVDKPTRVFPRTYGRRKDAPAAATVDEVLPDLPTAPYASASRDNSGFAPSKITSDDEDVTSKPTHATIRDRNDEDTDAESPVKKYTFSWKQKLAEIDDESDTDDANAQRGHVMPGAIARDANALRPPRSLSALKAAKGDDVFLSSLSTLPNSSQPESSPAPGPSPSQSQARSQAESPLQSTAKPKRSKRRAVSDNSSSESEDEGSSKSLLPTPALTHGPSSSDPSTFSDLEQSDSEMSRSKKATMLRERTLPEAKLREKGKARAKESDVFGGASDYDSSSRQGSEVPSEQAQTRTMSKRKSKVKAPTRKEEMEVLKESARLFAQRPAPGLARPDPACRPSVQGLLNKIYSRNPEAQLTSSELISDPIQPASSPRKPDDDVFGPAPLLTNPTRLPALAMTDLLSTSSRPRLHARGSTGSLSAKTAKLRPLNLDDSDDELPSITAELAAQRAKDKVAARRAELLQQKQRALEAQQQQRQQAALSANISLDDDDDDGLEITEDDMKSVAREEAKKRQLAPDAGGRKLGEGRKLQLQLATGRSMVDLTRRPSAVRRAAGPAALLAPAEGFAQTGGTSWRKAGAREGITDKAQLNQLLLSRAEEERQKEIKRKEEAWIERGGKIKVLVPLPNAEAGATPIWHKWAEKGLKNAQEREVEPMDEDEGSDGEFKPEEDAEDANVELDDDEDLGYVDNPQLRGSASPSPSPQNVELVTATDVEDEEMEDKENTAAPRPRRRPLTSRRAIVDSDDENQADENVRPMRREPTWGNILVPGTSLTEEAFLAQGPGRPKVRRVLTTLETPDPEEGFEDGTDKENDAGLRFDHSEDKENKTVPRLASPPATTSGRGPLAALRRGLSWSDDEQENVTAVDATGEDMRSPLRDLASPKEEPTFGGLLGAVADENDSPFSPVRKTASKVKENGFMSRLKSLSPAKGDVDAPTPVSLALSPAFGIKLGAPLSQFMDEDENDENATLKVGGLRAGFSDFDDFSTQEAGPSKLKGKRGGFDALRNAGEDFSLTFDGGLEPAIELSRTARQKADDIFNEEQGAVVEDSMGPPPAPEPEVWVNTQGYLTQTARSQAPYRPPSPSQASPFAPTQGLQRSPFGEPEESPQRERRPLGTLALVEPAELTPQQPLRRIRRARTPSAADSASPSPSPSPSHDAFAALRHGAGRERAREKKAKRKLEKSEFVEQEADESDEEAAFGFRTVKKGEDEESDGEDQDKNLEELVDDAAMDEETQAAQLVVQKFKEHQEEDDKVVEKVVQDAVQGKMRTKKRDRGIGFEDDESESEDENKVRRAKLPKKRRIEGDTLDAYRRNDELAAFVNTYDQAIADDNDELSFLQKEDVEMENLSEDRHAEEEEEEPREVINAEHVRQQLRAIAEGEKEYKEFNPHSVAFIDGDDSDDEPSVRFKEVTRVSKRPTRAADPDAMYQSKQPSERETAQAAAWLKQEGRSRTAGQGRSVAAAAVTGHRAKSGGGSLSNARRPTTEASTSASERRPKQASKLSTALKGSRGRFG